jgi:hydroxyethylthiazole kinase
MAHAREEVAEMVGLADALVLNIGTLTPELIDTMIIAAKAGNERGIPVVLDAVGAGATSLRTDSVMKVLRSAHIDVLKGNYGEIGALAGLKAKVKGVESMGVEGNPANISNLLSLQLANTVVMTGKIDVISGEAMTYLVKNGSPMMGSIVGTGCMAASVIGAFAAVEKDYTRASVAALACFGISGELAAKRAKGPGSFKERFYDEVYSLNQTKIKSKTRVSQQYS